jgi:hypothetical protein
MHDWAGGWGSMIGSPLFAGPFIGLFLILALWSFFWKGLALWHSARRGHTWWFVIMLVVNTAGILEIIYLFFVLKMRLNELFEMREHHHH